MFDKGGWHFNNLLPPEDISKKLKTFAHTEFSDEKFSSVAVIKQKIKDRVDLFERGEKYKKEEMNSTFPKYLLRNLDKYKEYII